MRKKITLILFGVALLAGSVLYFGDAMGWYNVSFNGWWAMFLIVPALTDMIARKVQLWNVIVLGVGAWLFLQEQEWEWLTGQLVDALAVALIIAALGVWLIAKALEKKPPLITEPYAAEPLPDGSIPPPSPGDNVRQHNPKVDARPRANYTALLSSEEYRNVCPELQNVQMSGIFGAVDADLTVAGIVHGAIVNVTSVFGGATLRLPQNVNVQMEGNAFLGSAENRLIAGFDPNRPTVIVKYFVLFGGAVFRH
ncbi:MAG: cell wall-active antibiotics response protein [Oscillospiraceae bacterium]|jgi:predicted membrane protein|nr:cell wall-active antibiotics response protein [Oscillospiraceae bacterium]